MKSKSFKEVFASIFARLSSFADNHHFEVDGIRYIITSSEKLTVELNRRRSCTGGISIPASVTYKCRTYAVTSIGDNAFWGCSDLTSR